MFGVDTPGDSRVNAGESVVSVVDWDIVCRGPALVYPGNLKGDRVGVLEKII